MRSPRGFRAGTGRDGPIGQRAVPERQGDRHPRARRVPAAGDRAPPVRPRRQAQPRRAISWRRAGSRLSARIGGPRGERRSGRGIRHEPARGLPGRRAPSEGSRRIPRPGRLPPAILPNPALPLFRPLLKNPTPRRDHPDRHPQGPRQAAACSGRWPPRRPTPAGLPSTSGVVRPRDGSGDTALCAVLCQRGVSSFDPRAPPSAKSPNSGVGGGVKAATAPEGPMTGCSSGSRDSRPGFRERLGPVPSARFPHLRRWRRSERPSFDSRSQAVARFRERYDEVRRYGSAAWAW